MFFLRNTIFIVLMALVCAGADSLRVRIMGWESPGAIWRTGGGDIRKGPVLVWLHGGMGSANCEKGLSAGLPLLDSALSFKGWVVSPSVCREHHWLNVGPALIDALLDSLEVRRGAAVDSVWLLGVSDGGLGVLAYTLEGRRFVARRMLVSVWLGQLADPSVLARVPRVRQGGWRFFQGGSDRLYPKGNTVPWMREFCAGMGSLQCLVQFDAAGEHDWAWWRAHRLEWLKAALR